MDNERIDVVHVWIFYFIALFTSVIPLHLAGVVGVFLWFLPVFFLKRGLLKNKFIFYFLLIFYWFLVLVLGLFVEGTFLYVPVFGILDV